MDDLTQLKQDANQRELDWRRYGLSYDYLTNFVMERLSGRSASGYDLMELFSEEAVAAILKEGIRTIDANRQGIRMASIGSGGRTGSLDEGPKLANAFREWASAGFVEFQEASGDGVSQAHLVKRQAARGS